MSKTAVITARLDAETLALVDQIAAAQGRTRSSFAAHAIRETAKREAEFRAFLQEGIDDLDAGRVYSHEEMFARLRARLAARKAA